MFSSITFAVNLLGKIFNEKCLSGNDLHEYVLTYGVASGNPTNEAEFDYSKTYAILGTRGKRRFACGFTIYEPTNVEELHYLSYWDETKRKCLLFDAHIADVSEIVEIGKFYVDNETATKVQRLINYANAILQAYFTGRRHLIVGTYYIGSTYHKQLLRVCNNILYDGKVTLKSGEVKDLILLHNTRHEAIKLLLKAAWEDVSELLKSQVRLKMSALF